MRKPVETLRKWRTQGYGPPAAKTGRSLLYRKAGIDEWLAERELESGRGRTHLAVGAPKGADADRTLARNHPATA